MTRVALCSGHHSERSTGATRRGRMGLQGLQGAAGLPQPAEPQVPQEFAAQHLGAGIFGPHMGLKVWESDQQKILIFGDGLF